MKCKRCGGEVATSKGDWDYAMIGLPVILQDVPIRNCPQCGDRGAAIPRIEELHRTIAQLVIRKRSRLTGAEVRFLRTYLGFTGADFAATIGVSAEHVSRWENDQRPVGASNDRLLRLLIANQEPVSHYPIEDLARISDDATPLRLGMRATKSGWDSQLTAA